MKLNPLTFLLSLSLALICGSCSSNYKVSDNSVIIEKDSIITEITVVNDNIIHVKKMLKDTALSALPDYVTILEPQDVKWSVSEVNGNVIVETSKIKACVNRDGEINYTTVDGKQLVGEINDETFINLKDSTTLHATSQSFSVGDEGLYGLGQFQSGIMNWKNIPVRLAQCNQEIAIPFLVSTNQYGIYWHNYSYTDFNYPKNILEISEVVDEKLNIKRASFTPTQTGEYTFLAEINDALIRRGKGVALLTINSDTVIHYSTMWIPDTFSGKKFLEAGKTYEVVFQNTNSKFEAQVMYNEPDFNKTKFSSKFGDAIDYYIVHGETPAAIISQYSKLTGKAPMFPKTALGFWQCRERYNSQEELLENAREMRKRKIPFDNIVQDWFYWPKGTKGPEWDRERYPDAVAMTDELNSMNVNLMVSVWPQVNNTPLLNKYNLEGRKIGKDNYLDIYDPEVQKLYYRMLSDSMFHLGVSSIWLDGTEPEGVTPDEFMTTVGEFGRVTNAYSLLVTKAMYEGKREEYPNQRMFNLTRSAYAGQQRNSVASWSGDVAATWEQLSEQIAAGLNFTMAGVPYWTTDIGGFFRDKNSINDIYDNQYTNPEYKELLTRWFQFGTFNPIFRIHGYASKTEVWRYGKEFEDMARKFLDIRYQLMPYIYSEAWKVTKDAKLLMAPLAYQYPNDKKTWGIKDQFFFGESMLINPVISYKARERELYLPEGNWYDFWTNEKIAGGKNITASAPLNSLPIYVKEGSIIPSGAKLQYATEEISEPTVLTIYPGKDASYSLYLDDNTTYEYENGNYSEINITYCEADKSLSISKGEGSYFDTHTKEINFTVVIAGSKDIKGVEFTGADVKVTL
ncbi:MAG: glycoside hydrolase family 31 protein [Rikenellaceae bacterium]